MRRFLLATALVAVAQGAVAADMPFLRGSMFDGPAVVPDWQGFYVGGQVGYGSADMNFSGSNDALIGQALGPNNILQGTVTSVSQASSKVNLHQATFGGFAGYNGQWDDTVLGVEANYMHGNFNGTSTVAPVPLTYVTPLADGLYHNVGLISSRSVSITDIGTVRARAGYAIGSFLPYLFAGVALGRAELSSNVLISDRSDATLAGAANGPRTIYTATDSIGGKMLYGYAAGLGTEVMLFGNLFARAEWEYLRFVNAGADVNINTVRGGLGYKF
ncbi:MULTISPECIES: outer membrane beta-barrel protein [Rhodopseudomonas]|uniref:Outer membrane insertion C-terminal signal n=1 Tax=Rhodopseudomonas palustris TaxID=1076 RepID=A0A0D7EVT7_RHOPL|nr:MULTISPECIES: outer membrane beta-barrel protein [Rhodopseudomonas]KIZ44741.1 outer membrane insertion C-terminal signal [Rhodopseudomonas palustris]MDF3814124.1 outer membrane beta-barrel protein [Rhodopseudomonas sp. BAL398]WOK15508.1 outer membrane beta-barrel protein [Rhodopseudomonas sp. BAL398]